MVIEHEDTTDERDLIGRATYSPEDNKLRIYPEGTRVDSVLSETEYSSFKAAGYKWAGKQECFVCPRWTPTAEDWAMRLCGEIDDEDYSPEERSADRAERFGGYLDKRRAEAGDKADTFEARPSAFGHQNRARAERQARRHDRHRTNALSQWSKAEYWQDRTAGVIAHALYRSSAPVRRGRIKTIETDQRKFLKDVAEAQERYDAWREVIDMPGADELIPMEGDRAEWNAAQRKAYNLANVGGSWWHTAHPTSEEANAKQKELRTTFAGFSAYDFLTKTEYLGAPFQRLTPKQVAELYVKRVKNPAEQQSWIRWRAHYELRLNYERTMLAQEGGAASSADMEPGGWILPDRRAAWRLRHSAGRWLQIIKVNKSNTTGRVVSVAVLALTDTDYDRKGQPWSDENPRPTVEHLINVERLAEDAYRAPTDEERAAFNVATKERKAKRKATAPKVPPLINPTDADADRLQAIWNAIAKERHDKAVAAHRTYGDYTPVEVLRLTQAVYSANSKGAYAKVEPRTVHAGGLPGLKSSNMYCSERSEYLKKIGPALFKIRTAGYDPLRVIVITDKPQKALPFDAPEAAEEPEAEPVAAGQLF